MLVAARDEAGSIPPELRATARAAAEAAIEALRLKGYTEEADRIAKQFAANNMADPVYAANDAARLLVGTLATAVEMQNALNRSSAIGGQASGRGDGMSEWRRRQADLQGSGQEQLTSPSSALGSEITKILSPSRASGGGAGGGSAARERESIMDVIAAQRLELDILRETNPVQQELLRHREALSAATPKQRAELEGLITVYQAEKERMDEIKAASNELRSNMEQSFVGLIRGADSFGEALGRVLDKIADMAASSAFDMLWDAASGGGGGGGLFGGFMDWLIPGKADGGQVIGAGGPREDNLLHWLSNGEFVVNAASTSQYLPLLEAINAGMSPRELMPALLGRVPRLADGGRVGVISAARLPSLSGTSASAGATTPSGTIVLQATINLAGARGDREIEQAAAAGMQSAIAQAIDHYDRLILPQRVQEISDDPRTIG
ncbi:MAG: hypothetical protein IE922_09640 [Sphingomonadales bacterium]|nr:hypothetical protein [Sphingomonadales bacterium]